jgi:hypothetical protein
MSQKIDAIITLLSSLEPAPVLQPVLQEQRLERYVPLVLVRTGDRQVFDSHWQIEECLRPDVERPLERVLE